MYTKNLNLDTWKRISGARNYVKNLEGGFLSYNPNTENSLLGAFGAGDTPKETAICVYREDGNCEYFILNGDWREKLDNLTLAECLVVYKNNPEARSSWSSDSGLEQTLTRILENFAKGK